MSGGHFDYQQFRLNDIATEIDELIARNEYPKDITEKFKQTSRKLKKAASMVQRIDYLVCGDDGEESFRERWEEEVGT